MDLLVSAASRMAHASIGGMADRRLSILIFHRVHARADAMFPDEQDAPRFERLMRFVSRSFNVMTLARAANALQSGNLPKRALVVTFDDGYADNAEVALPILQRCGLVATFFVSTGFLDGGRMWNDSVIEAIRRCRNEEVDLDAFGLGLCSLTGPKERRTVVDKLLPRIKYLTVARREEAIAHLQRLSGVSDLPRDLMMRAEQVRQLQRAGMEIGGHTVGHPILTTLDAKVAESEIDGGRQRLQEILDAPVDVFAYPNGKPGRDYDHSHVALVKKLGFSAAVSTVPGVGRSGDDLFQLPRYTPWDRALTAWAARLLIHQRNTRFEVAVPAGA